MRSRASASLGFVAGGRAGGHGRVKQDSSETPETRWHAIEAWSVPPRSRAALSELKG